MELVDVGDSKSPGSDAVPVRVRPGALEPNPRFGFNRGDARVFHWIRGKFQVYFWGFSITDIYTVFETPDLKKIHQKDAAFVEVLYFSIESCEKISHFFIAV